jgi:hypothetical protein
MTLFSSATINAPSKAVAGITIPGGKLALK